MTDRPRDIFLEGCRSIGRDLAEDGFRVTKRGQLLHRTRGTFLEEIHFQSSHNNEDGYVVLTPSARIESNAFGDWRHTSGIMRPGHVAGVNIGHLDGSGWATWNIGDPAERERTLATIVAAIRTYVFPWFDLVETNAALADAARHGKVPGFVKVEDLIEYLVHAGEPSAARDHLEAWLAQYGARMLPEQRATMTAMIQKYDLDLAVPPPVDPSRSFIARLVARFRATALTNADVPLNRGGVERPRVDWKEDEE